VFSNVRMHIHLSVHALNPFKLIYQPINHSGLG
jgi:hypothetical protein